MFKALRITILLVLLLLAAGHTWLTRLRTTAWDLPLTAVVYPINGDGSATANRYIAGLTPDAFEPMVRFLAQEGEAYGLSLAEPVRIELAGELSDLPPEAPRSGNIPQIMLWSLRLRWWAWRSNNYQDPVDIKLFVLYYDPASHKSLDHSLGLQKGQIGVVKAFGDRRDAARNQVVITHELLHTLGASDKYDPLSAQPLFPDGYAEPERKPLLPQELAELMGGLIPLQDGKTVMPDNLGQVLIGPATAREIGW
jgi:hypothetical protein